MRVVIDRERTKESSCRILLLAPDWHGQDAGCSCLAQHKNKRSSAHCNPPNRLLVFFDPTLVDQYETRRPRVPWAELPWLSLHFLLLALSLSISFFCYGNLCMWTTWGSSFIYILFWGKEIFDFFFDCLVGLSVWNETHALTIVVTW